MLRLLFAAVMLHVGLRALYLTAPGSAQTGPRCLHDPETGRLRWTRRCGRMQLVRERSPDFVPTCSAWGASCWCWPAPSQRPSHDFRGCHLSWRDVISHLSSATVASTIAGIGLDRRIATPFGVGALAGVVSGRGLPFPWRRASNSSTLPRRRSRYHRQCLWRLASRVRCTARVFSRLSVTWPTRATPGCRACDRY